MLFATIGLAMTVWWLWQTATLQEEDAGYFVMPMGQPGSLSRLENDKYRQWQGRKAARDGLWQTIPDRWHDRLANSSAKSIRPTVLADYGWGTTQPEIHAAMIFTGLTLFALVYAEVIPLIHGREGNGLHAMFFFWALGIPSFGPTLNLRNRRPRLAQELLRPASRIEYFRDLFRAMAKQSLLLWLATIAALWLVIAINQEFTPQDKVTMAVVAAIGSLAFQVPALGIGLLLARIRSSVLFFLCVFLPAIVGFAFGTAWLAANKWGTTGVGNLLPIATFTAILMVITGLPLFAWARRSWLNAELG